MARSHTHVGRFTRVTLGFVLTLVLASPLAVQADTPAYIIADPNPVTVPFGSDFALVNVTYNSGDGSIPEIYANEGAGDGGAIVLKSSMGTLQLSVKYGVQNLLKLYSKGKTTLLASVVVTTVRPDLHIQCDAECLQRALANHNAPKSLTLNARDVTSHYWYDRSSSGAGCLLGDLGNVGGEGYDYNALKAAGKIVEGFAHFYDPGTDPLPCEELFDTYYRGAVNFDLSAIKQYAKANNFQHATLSFQVDQTDDSYYSSACLGHIQGNALPWSGIDLGKASPLESDFTPKGDHVEVDVASTVLWAVLLGDSNDLNFLLIGRNEGFPQDNIHCATVYRNFTLTLAP